MLRMPLRELNARFTKSELFISAWRSQEQAEAFRKPSRNDHRPPPPQQPANGTTPDGTSVKIAPGQPVGYPPEYYDETGHFNLSKVRGKDAFNYFKSLGIVLPVIAR